MNLADKDVTWTGKIAFRGYHMKRLFITFAFLFLLSLSSVFSFAFAQERRLITQDNLWFQGAPYYSNYKINGIHDADHAAFGLDLEQRPCGQAPRASMAPRL
jgi:hypothetical protein